jgi:uncharacterized heparinase superfamily protein
VGRNRELQVFEYVSYQARRLALVTADHVATSSVVRWVWSGFGETDFGPGLVDFRPNDRDAVHDMMAGRYVMAARLVDTGGASPFSIRDPDPEWSRSLRGFAWLRHFRDLRDPGARSFARTLVLDWIASEGLFDRKGWDLGLTAKRVLNWLRHIDLLGADATPEQSNTIQRALRTQLQSLRVRLPLAISPVDKLLAATALVGAAICERGESLEFEPALLQLNAILGAQIDGDGMHLSRNPATQLLLLVELASVRRSLGAIKSEAGHELTAQVDRMHEALDALTLGSGEPTYANGGGQLPHDVLIAVQANAAARRRRSGVIGGFGVLRDGESVVVADGGQVPPVDFAADAHSGCLGVEFSHGTETIFGNCGPAPSQMADSRDLFRQSVAHSGLTINQDSIDHIGRRGPLAGYLRPMAEPLPPLVKTADHVMTLATDGYAQRFGVRVERRLSLLSGGATFVGQDRLSRVGDATPSGQVSIRFHLAPGIMVRRTSEGLIRLILPNGAVWTFLWEGAALREDDSVRQSAYRGFDRTRQLVLEAEVRDGIELGWIFTKDQP